jgi:O-antigen/teichoic acid export membrane protein
MPNQQLSYRQIMKSTSIFGGVQVFQIIIQIIRSKFIAVLLGPSGMGIIGLFTTTLSLIGNLTGFGLGSSAIRNISEAVCTGDKQRISTVIIVLRRLVWITGLLGAIVTASFSSLLSRVTFGSSEYTYAFIWLSVTLLINQLFNGQKVLLRGTRKIQYLAKANLYGSVLGLILTIPLYYILGVKGIVPGIIITSLISLALSWFYSRKINLVQNISVSKDQTITEGKSMLVMGFMLSLSSLISVGASYLVRIFISKNGGLDDVGLYNAGFAILSTYTGLIFTAMSTDYYPKLAAESKNNELCKQTINHQTDIAILILAPILVLFILFVHWFIVLLYSDKFVGINEMMQWAALGMFFKTLSWAISFLFIAKGVSKLYFWSELSASIYMISFNIIGYYFGGLTGLGISFLIAYLLYFIQVFFIANKMYEFLFSKLLIQIFVFQFALALSSFICIMYISKPYSYILGIFIFVISCIYSYKEIEKRVAIKSMVLKFLSKTK